MVRYISLLINLLYKDAFSINSLTDALNFKSKSIGSITGLVVRKLVSSNRDRAYFSETSKYPDLI